MRSWISSPTLFCVGEEMKKDTDFPHTMFVIAPNMSKIQLSCLHKLARKHLGPQVIAEEIKNATLLVMDPSVTSIVKLYSSRLEYRKCAIQIDLLPKVKLDWLCRVIQLAKADVNRNWENDPQFSPQLDSNMWKECEEVMETEDEATMQTQPEQPPTKQPQLAPPESPSTTTMARINTLESNKKVADTLLAHANLLPKHGTDMFRANAYRKAAQVVRSMTVPLTSSSQLPKVRGIGSGLLQHVDEILHTGKFEKLDVLENDPMNRALAELQTVHGIGEILAIDLYKKGIHRVDDLLKLSPKEQAKLVSANSVEALKHYHDLQTRISRPQAEQALALIKQELEALLPPEDTISIQLAGSYRRGSETMGDIDVIIHVTSRPEKTLCIGPLVNRLVKCGFVRTVLGMSKHDGDPKSLFENIQRTGWQPNSTSLICMLPQTNFAMHVDIKTYPKRSFAFGLLFFSSGEQFNRELRLFANNKRNLTLTNTELCPFFLAAKREKIKKMDQAIECNTEEEIFNVLRLKYIPPHERGVVPLVEK